MEPSTETRQDAQVPKAGATPPSLSSELASSIVCGGCGSIVDAAEPYPFRCPRSGDGGDHVLRRVLDVGRLSFSLDDAEPNPFVRWRGLFHSYHLACAHGMSDRAYVEMVRGLDSEVAPAFSTCASWRVSVGGSIVERSLGPPGTFPRW